MQLRGKAAAACVAAALVVACGCAWFLFRDAPRAVAAHTKTESAPPSTASTASPAAVPPAAPVADSAAPVPAPAVACAGEPWEAQPGDPCALAMDHRFSGERVLPARLFSGHAGWFPDGGG